LKIGHDNDKDRLIIQQ